MCAQDRARKHLPPPHTQEHASDNKRQEQEDKRKQIECFVLCLAVPVQCELVREEGVANTGSKRPEGILL